MKLSTTTDLIHFPRSSILVLLMGFIAMAWVYNYHNIMFELPQSVHQWRQADCLSLTSNYCHDQNPFLEPSMHFLGADGTGKTISEFPLFYYLVGKIWIITGEKIWIYRSIIALCFLAGLLAVFRLVENELKNSWAAIFTSLLLFTSPVLLYYSNNFLMNIPAFSFAAIGLYFFFQYKRQPRLFFFIAFCLSYLLAALLKASALLSFFAILILFFIQHINGRFLNISILRKKPSEYILIACTLILPVFWYRYAIHYNQQHTGGIFLIGILPIWEMTVDKIQETFRYIGIHLRWDYFRPFTEIVLLIFLLLLVPLRKFIDKYLLLLILFTGMGSVAFLILFFGALQWHDYYIIDLYIFTPLLLLAFFQGLFRKFPRISSSIFTYLLLLIFLVHSADFARRRYKERYDINNYRNLHHRNVMKAFSEIEPLLQSLNIGPEAKVLSLSDHSINISLYLMHRKGWTHYGTGLKPEGIERRIEQGARYLFIADPRTKENPDLAPYLKNKIGTHRNIEIYDLGVF